MSLLVQDQDVAEDILGLSYNLKRHFGLEESVKVRCMTHPGWVLRWAPKLVCFILLFIITFFIDIN